MIHAFIRTLQIIGWLILCVSILPFFLVLALIVGIFDLFEDKTKPMTKEEYYGSWRL